MRLSQLSTFALAAVVAVVHPSSRGLPQDAKPAQDGKTKLEAFQAKSGVVIVRGFTTIGSVQITDNIGVDVECREFKDAGTGKRELGIAVAVRSYSGIQHESTSYVDYDEIDSLIAGIDYINKLDKTATRLKNFQADYRTRGDLTISTYSTSNGEIEASVSSGRIGAVQAYVSLANTAQLRAFLVKAKETLDAIK
jgi:hypothetical protein